VNLMVSETAMATVSSPAATKAEVSWSDAAAAAAATATAAAEVEVGVLPPAMGMVAEAAATPA